MTYREPTIDDIGKIVEVTDLGPEHKRRHWVTKRLCEIDDAIKHKFVACSEADNPDSALKLGNYDVWQYARIETNS